MRYDGQSDTPKAKHPRELIEDIERQNEKCDILRERQPT